MNTNINKSNNANTVYLVTSAAGFMGGIVVRKLLERGEKVRAFVLNGDPAAHFVPAGAEIFEGDVCDKESLKSFFTVPEGILIKSRFDAVAEIGADAREIRCSSWN